MKLLLDVHTHSISSGHAYSTIQENAAVAKAKGLALMAVTEHAPKMPGSVTELYFQNLRVLPKIIHGVEILKGAELNILDKNGSLDLSQDTLAALDVVIASLHPPCLPSNSQTDFTDNVINAIKNPHVNIIGHLGDPRYPLNIKKVVQAAKEFGVMIELNNSSLSPLSFRPGGEHLLEELVITCVSAGVPLVVGSDAHYADNVGEFGFALTMLEKLKVPPHCVLNTDVIGFKELL